MTVRESIDKFITFFSQQRLAIGQLKALPIYRKILYLVEIDALSRAAFPDEKGHKDRVLKFLNEYSNWSIGDRVSAIHLQDSLKKMKNSQVHFSTSSMPESRNSRTVNQKYTQPTISLLKRYSAPHIQRPQVLCRRLGMTSFFIHTAIL